MKNQIWCQKVSIIFRSITNYISLQIKEVQQKLSLGIPNISQWYNIDDVYDKLRYLLSQCVSPTSSTESSKIWNPRLPFSLQSSSALWELSKHTKSYWPNGRPGKLFSHCSFLDLSCRNLPIFGPLCPFPQLQIISFFISWYKKRPITRFDLVQLNI